MSKIDENLAISDPYDFSEEELSPYSQMWRIKEETDKINKARKAAFVDGLDCPYPDEFIEKTIKEVKKTYEIVSQNAGPEDPHWLEDHQVPVYIFGWQYYRTVKYVANDRIQWSEDYYESGYDEDDFNMIEDEAEESGYRWELKPGTPKKEPRLDHSMKYYFFMFVQGYADSEMYSFIEGYKRSHDPRMPMTSLDIKISPNTANEHSLDTDLGALKKMNNTFSTFYTMTVAVDYFYSKFSQENSEGIPYLYDRDIIEFLRQAFVQNKPTKPLKINMPQRGKTECVQIFKKFWDMVTENHNEKRSSIVTQRYQKLATDYFENLSNIGFVWSPRTKKKQKHKPKHNVQKQ